MMGFACALWFIGGLLMGMFFMCLVMGSGQGGDE